MMLIFTLCAKCESLNAAVEVLRYYVGVFVYRNGAGCLSRKSILPLNLAADIFLLHFFFSHTAFPFHEGKCIESF